MPPSAIDLFAGCGGLSLGLSRAGYVVEAANELDAWAAETYIQNHAATKLLQGDIRNWSTEYWRQNYGGAIDLIAGGPPCQGFSVSGKRQYGHVPDGNSLVEAFLDVVEAVMPRMVLIENVSGFRTGQIRPGVRVLTLVQQKLQDFGYHVYAATLQAAEFGVPSIRSRFFLVASKDRFVGSPFPEPCYHQGAKGKPALRTVEEAIGDLPPLAAGEGHEGPQRYGAPAQNAYQRRMRSRSPGVFNHVAMKHTPRLVERFEQIRPGQCSYRIGRHSKADEIVTVYKSNNQRLHPDRPSLCITANFQSTYIHPHQHRNLTAREAARLMTFPDTFVFQGKRTQMSSGFLKKYGREHEDFLSQYNQIGNAVPPLLAEMIASSLLGSTERITVNARPQYELAW